MCFSLGYSLSEFLSVSLFLSFKSLIFELPASIFLCEFAAALILFKVSPV